MTSYGTPSLFFCFLTLVLVFTFLSYLSPDNDYFIKAQQMEQQMEQQMSHTRTGAPLTIIPGLTGNVLTVVAFLIGTSSFILGLRIQSAYKKINLVDDGKQINESTLSSSSTTIIKYYELLIMALVLPAIVINIYGILVVSGHIYSEDAPYLLLLFVLFIPIGVILFLVKKLH